MHTHTHAFCGALCVEGAMHSTHTRVVCVMCYVLSISWYLEIVDPVDGAAGVEDVGHHRLLWFVVVCSMCKCLAVSLHRPHTSIHPSSLHVLMHAYPHPPII